MEQFLVLVILNDDRRLPAWSSIVHTRDKESKMNTFGSSNTHLDEINWCYTEWRLVFTMCVNNRYVSSHARRCEGGVYKCVRQPARIRLFKDRVMRAKSNTCTWSFLSRSAPIMRERERATELVSNNGETTRQANCANMHNCIVYHCAQKYLNLILFPMAYVISRRSTKFSFIARWSRWRHNPARWYILVSARQPRRTIEIYRTDWTCAGLNQCNARCWVKR